jgi:hypothetical protein
MRSLVERNFRISVAVLLVGCLASLLWLNHAWAAVDAVYGGFAYNVYVAPSVAFLATSICWFIFYRNDEGHWEAFYIGFFLVVGAIGVLASSAFNDLPYSKAEFAIALYAGTSHICYGLLDWRSVFKTLGQETRRRG